MIASEETASRRILVVEVRPEVRRRLGERLQQDGFEVDLAAGAKEAVAALTANRHQLAVLGDTAPKPVINLAYQLRKAVPGLHAVMLTGSAGPPVDNPDAWLHTAPADDPRQLTVILLRVTNRALERALREAHRFQRRITETVPEHIYLYDVELGRTIYANHKLETLLAPEGSADGRPLGHEALLARVHQDDVAAVQALLDGLDAGDEQVATGQFRVRQADGAERLLRARNVAFARHADGRVRQVLGLLQDVTEREKAKEALHASREELRQLAQHLQSVRDEERSGIARELHDQLGQELTALKIRMSMLKGARDQLQPEVADNIDTMSELVTTTTETVRRLSRDLRPHPTAHLGLVPAIRWHVDEFSRQIGIEVRFQSALSQVELNRERETHLFRILQEALTNVARHAAASKVEVDLSENVGNLVLTVADDGRGISEDAIASGKSIGLTGMRERAHLCGGEVTIFCAPGAGTIIRARIPLSDAAADPMTGEIVIGGWPSHG